ncbi:MAG: DMT family transporter [Myxococcales bacterium]|nr:DMT family transporter [Myxococcales bacterium]
MAGHGLLIYATEYIEASIMAPLHYTEILGATLLGYIMFGDLPDGFTILGCAIVIVAGLVITYREHRRA